MAFVLLGPPPKLASLFVQNLTISGPWDPPQSWIQLGLRVNELGISSDTYGVVLLERGKEDARAVGEYTHVFVQRETNRPAASGMPEQIRRGLERLLVDEKPEL